MYYIATGSSQRPMLKPVRSLYTRYLREEVIPSFQPLTVEQYLGGPIGIVHTAARFSYVLDNSAVNWCIEWRPGLLVINVTPNSMQWAARRSPDPQFGGRSATAAEIESYEKWEQAWESQHLAPPPQYGLIFDPWTDILEQSFTDWKPASEQQTLTIHKVFDWLDALAESLRGQSGGKTHAEQLEEWGRSYFWTMQWRDMD